MTRRTPNTLPDRTPGRRNAVAGRNRSVPFPSEGHLGRIFAVKNT